MDNFPRKPQVYFSRRSVSASRMAPGVILICPVADQWNDFGLRTLFEYTLVFDNDQTFKRKLRLAFIDIDDQSPHEIVNNVFRDNGQEILSSDNFPNFFTLQLTPDAYIELANEFEDDQFAEDILLYLNDLTFVSKKRQHPTWFENALSSRAFNLSFLRTADGFRAFHEGYQFFWGKGKLNDVLPPKILNLRFKLDCFENHHEFKFSFKFGGILEKRIAVIIGKNGVGKSRALSAVVDALLNKRKFSDLEVFSQPAISRLIAICTPGETEATFPQSAPINESISYLRLSGMTSPNRDIDFEPLTSVLQKLLRLNATESGMHRWEIFKHAVSKVLPVTELCIIPQSKRRELDEYDQIAVDGNAVRLIDLWFGGEQGRLEAARRMNRDGILVRIVDGRAYLLSSGQISFIRLAAQLCLNVNYGTLVLIDEPETHLHPNLISDLVVMLNDILAICNSVAIVATHSAYMVREVPSSQVHHISVDSENLIDIGPPRLKTFGADVGAISNFIFEDGFINRFSLEAVERIENLSLNYDAWEEELKDELSTEALMFFRRKLKSKLQEGE